MDQPELIEGLDPHQKELVKALKEKNENAAKVYLGAVLVLKHVGNPDRIALCAHGLRELMDQMPKFIDVPIVKEARQQLGHFADALVDEWRDMIGQDRWPGDPPWDGGIDDSLKKFLFKAETLVQAHVSIREGRRIQVKAIIKKQNFSSVPLPEDIEDLHARVWDTYRNNFVKAAHHNSITEDEFTRYVTNFEHLLLSYLKPRTFETQNEILKVIEEAQGDK